MTLYVSQSGSATTGCTSSGAACQTITEGVTAAELLTGDDVTIDVAASATSYDENVAINDSANPTLTIAGAGATTTTIDGSASGCDVTIANGVVTVSGMTITNGNGISGGGVCNSDEVTLTNDTISNNHGSNGGGVNNSGTATLTDDVVSGNTATGDGGGVYSLSEVNDAQLTMTGTTVTQDSGGRGGGVFSGGGGFTLTNDVLSHDSASEGGGLDNYGGGLATGTTFLDDSSPNTSSNGGGGIFSAHQLTLTGDSLTGDTAGSRGGGISTTGPITATQDTISGDSAPLGGGLSASGFVTLTNDTLSGDSATVTGGAILNNSRVTMSFDTLSDDTAPAGQGPGLYDGNTAIIGTSILDNAGCTLPAGATMTSNGYNVESDNSCDLGSGNTLSSSSIHLAAGLAANGSTGPQTLAISSGSSAFEEVPNAACAATTTDERGEARPGAAGQTSCDAGAYELQFHPTVPSAPRSPHAKAGKKAIELSWKAPKSTGGDAISGYRVYCSRSKHVKVKGAGSAKASGHSHSVTVKKLKKGKTYYCVVAARNAVGSSKPSATVHAKPRA